MVSLVNLWCLECKAVRGENTETDVNLYLSISLSLSLSLSLYLQLISTGDVSVSAGQ